ncbi:MAG: nucleolar RNA-binding Nop10p family protein [Nanoarchaeota archaeon]
MNQLLMCKSCYSFTLKEQCICGAKTYSPIPQRYSPEEKYVELKRQAKENDRIAAGLL